MSKLKQIHERNKANKNTCRKSARTRTSIEYELKIASVSEIKFNARTNVHSKIVITVATTAAQIHTYT